MGPPKLSGQCRGRGFESRSVHKRGYCVHYLGIADNIIALLLVLRDNVEVTGSNPVGSTRITLNYAYLEQSMKLYITASFKNGENEKEIERLCALVKEAGFEDFCFIRDVENYQKLFDNPQELMQRAKEEIEKSDGLLIDVTEKPTGRAIEAGIAFALGKKIVVIAKSGTKIKDTTRGITDIVVEYNVIDDIVQPLQEWLSGIETSQ